MSAVKHPPGPWIANDQHAGVGWRVESDAEGYPNDGWVVTPDLLGPDAEANANLIAAAPDLYEALATLLGETNPQIVHPIGIGDARDRARAALAKARGEAQ